MRTAGNGASRNEKYDAENTCTTSAWRSCRSNEGQYTTCVTTVRRNLTFVIQRRPGGGVGLMGPSQAWMSGSSRHERMRREACTACPPRIPIDGATIAIWRRLFNMQRRAALQVMRRTARNVSGQVTPPRLSLDLRFTCDECCRRTQLNSIRLHR